MRILFSYLWKLFQSQRKETSIIKSSPPSLDIQIRETEQSRNKLRPSPEGARQEKIPPAGSGRVPQDARPAAVVDLCGELVAPPFPLAPPWNISPAGKNGVARPSFILIRV